MPSTLSSLLAAAGLLAQAQQAVHAQSSDNPWPAAYSKADSALAKMSQADKVGIISGVGWSGGKCIGNTKPASSIGYPTLCLQDSPLGVRYATSVTAFTPGIQAASTWDRALIRERGKFLGEEFKGSGVHVILGPVAGALGKFAEGGRNWEGFGPDPYLTGIAMAETILGIQGEGVQACAKHYLLNEQEKNRETMSSRADDRTLRELYAWPFADALHANVASVMCSYNKINGTYACENPYTLNTLLKGEMGFQGYVMSDWGATHTTTGSANGGLDMTMPGSDYNKKVFPWGDALSNAVNSNQVTKSRLDDMARRVLAAWYLVGQDKINFPSFSTTANVQGNHKTNVRAVARDGIVLLQNTNNTLPLSKPRSVALVGTGGFPNPSGMNSCNDRACNKGALGMGWGSGTTNYPYFVTPSDAIRDRASKDGTQVINVNSDDASQGRSSDVANAEVAIVFITSDSGEGYLNTEGVYGDRNNLDPWHNGNALVQAVAGVNKKTIVVIHSTGPVLLETIYNTPGVVAVVWAGLPSSESGNALVDIVWGDYTPSGKLPYTIAKSWDDYGAKVVSGDDNYPEGLYIDYRALDKAGKTPRHAFGFGLSYTTFNYSALSITASGIKSGPATGTIEPGGRKDLWDVVARATVTVSNTGSRDGAEVAQLYVSYPASASAPKKQLRGFDKKTVKKGGSETFSFELRRRDLSYWDASRKEWVLPSGTFNVAVGGSSDNAAVTGTIVVS